MELADLEKRLALAQDRLKRATAALAPKHIGGEWEEYQAAYDEVKVLEREIAATKGESYAVPLEFPVQWSIGAPLPHVISNDYRTFLTFIVKEADPAWDGTYVTVRSPDNEETLPLALVEFHRCFSTKLGAPNDEVLKGHPLSGRGLGGYSAQRVENSPWIAELETINKVHRAYDPETWRKLNHYIFWFHDSTFECVAETFTVEVFHESMAQILARICQRLTG